MSGPEVLRSSGLAAAESKRRGEKGQRGRGDWGLWNVGGGRCKPPPQTTPLCPSAPPLLSPPPGRLTPRTARRRPGFVELMGPALVVAFMAIVTASFLTVWNLEAQSGTMQRIQYGEVISAQQGIVRDQATGRGAQTGATVGAIAGYALADRGDRWIGGLLGGVLGGAAGHAAEKSAKKRPGWELIIKLDSGEEVGVQVPSPRKKRDRQTFRVGDRVRMMTGPNGRTQVTPA